MAGLTGFFSPDSLSESPEQLGRMIPPLRFTGRESVDTWTDGSLHIARVHHGVVQPYPQPIFCEDRTRCIIMAGEVFGYGEDRDRLIAAGHRFQYPDSDAEYILHLWEAEGDAAFKKLNGNFCCALYNAPDRSLKLVTDRFLSYPLFYSTACDGILHFGTNLASILQDPRIPRVMNFATLCDFFAHQSVPERETFLEDIHCVPHATVLDFKEGAISRTAFWTRDSSGDRHSLAYYEKLLADGLTASMRRRARDNHRTGIFISGGRDSRLVLHLLPRPPRVGFTFADFENREIHIAREICRMHGVKHVFIPRDPDHYARLVDEAVRIGDGMYSVVHGHGIGFFNRICEECDLMYHGLFFDWLFKSFRVTSEEFGEWHRKLAALPPDATGQIHATVTDLVIEKGLYRKGAANIFSEPYLHHFRQVLEQSIQAQIQEAAGLGIRDPLKLLEYCLTHGCLRHGSAFHLMHIRPYVDERSIALDNELLDWHIQTPFHLKIKGSAYTSVLRKYFPEIAALPDANDGLPLMVPEPLRNPLRRWYAMLRKGKQMLGLEPSPQPWANQGSWPRYGNLIRYNEPLRTLIADTINDPACLNPAIFNVAAVRGILDEHLAGTHNHWELLFLLLTFGRWHKMTGPHEPPLPMNDPSGRP